MRGLECITHACQHFLGVGAKEGRRVLAEGYYVGQDTGRMGYTKQPQRDTAVDSSCARCMYVYVYVYVYVCMYNAYVRIYVCV